MISQAAISDEQGMPTVDVICSVKNGGAQFAATIDSVLNQTFQDFRFVIIDDGSDDGETVRVAGEAAARDGRVVVHRNAVSQGLTANLVEHVDRSDAIYIARIDAGDMWLPEKLERQIAVMVADKEVVILGTQCDYVTLDGNIIGRSRFGEGDRVIRKAFKSGQGIFTHSSILFRRTINYRPEFKYSQDLDLYLRASELGRLQCMREPLTLCLISPDGLTLKRKYLQRKYQALAYRSHFSRANAGKEIDLRVSDRWLERSCWNVAMPFYHRYINARTNKQSVLVWGVYLALSLILFPPLLGDYLRRFLYSRSA